MGLAFSQVNLCFCEGSAFTFRHRRLCLAFLYWFSDALSYSPFNLNLPMQYHWPEIKTLVLEFKELQCNIHEESTMKFPTCQSHLPLILYSLQLGHAYNFKTLFAFFGLTNFFFSILTHFS